MEQQQDKNQNQQPRPKLVWKQDKNFSDKSGLTVVVSKTVGPRPFYSFQIGRLREDGSVATNIQWRTQRGQATFELENDHATILVRLMAEAQEHVVTQMQWDWAQNVDRQVERDTARGGGDNKGQKFVRAPGKTARDKAKGHKG